MQKRSGTSLGRAALLLLGGIPAIYFFSVPLVYWLGMEYPPPNLPYRASEDHAPRDVERYARCYNWVRENSLLGGPLNAYYKWWWAIVTEDDVKGRNL
jgi:hypothetical protein